jgi:ORF6N domain
MKIIQSIQNRIYEIRGERVMLDKDLAALYGTETKTLNLSVRRNLRRFPEDFMFQITKEEFEALRIQFETRSTTRWKIFWTKRPAKRSGMSANGSVLK